MNFGSDMLSFLASAAARATVLALVAAAAIFACRVRSAAARHAVWTMVLAGMLATALLMPVLPSLPLRVLHATTVTGPAVLPESQIAAASQTGSPHGSAPTPETGNASGFGWPEAAVGIYAVGVLVLLIRLAFSYSFAVRLVRASRRIEQPWAGEIHESSWISVPMTVGWLRPKILLPIEWESWSLEKRDAVLAHERTHVQRADWAISVAAGLNRCLFWFHPVAWWLERRLASLAEEACDDSALLLVGTESYAEALLDMAAAVRTGQGRLVWEAMAMAKASEVRKRIELILDETRQIPKGLTRLRWAAVAALSVPLIYLATVLQPARIQAEPPQTTSGFTQADAAQLEQRLAANPHDLGARQKLILQYFAANEREPRLSHIYWLIENHPESQEAGAMSLGITPRPTAMSTTADYNHAAELWKQQAGIHSSDARVLANAADFFAQPGGDLEEATRLLQAARKLDPSNGVLTRKLANVYATAILSTSGDSAFDRANFVFGQRVKSEVESSDDFALRAQTATLILGAARKPPAGGRLPPGTLSLDEHPALAPVVDWARGLIRPQTVGRDAPAAAVSAQVESTIPPAPEPLNKVNPDYPPLAKQARISGTVHLRIVIGTDGKPQNITVMSGHPLLTPAAIEAVKQWTWNSSATGTYSLNVEFNISDVAQAQAAAPAQGGMEQFARFQRAPMQSDAAPPRKGFGSMISKVDPVYPQAAREAGIEGVVHVVVTIGEDGHVETAEAIDGHPLLQAAALEAVKQWVWPVASLPPSGPNTKRGMKATIAVPFSLNE